ncbi:MAG TPA: hypothetical protein VMF59_06380, partial [Bacteroidota bacterium]|nr:hypothetical protein [Bacteroidota bacterium]
LIWSGFIQDRIDLTGVQITLGIRYDFIDPGAKDLANPYAIQLGQNGLLLASQIVSDATTSQISPRIGLAVPLGDRVILHGQLGRFVQAATTFGGGMNVALVSEGEAGVSAQAGDLFSFDVTGFYKSISHELGIVRNPGYLIPVQFPVLFPNAGVSSQYQFWPGTVDVYPKGIEIALSLHRTDRLAAQLNYTLQSVNTGWFNSLNQPQIGGGPIYVTQAYQSAVDFNTAHHGSLLLDYRFGKDDGGPVLEQSGINLVLAFHSGYAVTGDQPNRSWTTPGFAQIDGRIDKMFAIGPVTLDLYLYAINLLGTDNAVNVFSRTGDPSNDGWLSSPSGALEASQNGPQYVAFYKAVNEGKNSGNWGPPRQIRFGARLEL